MGTRRSFKVIRDPVWNNVPLDREALEIIDSEPFQRLRYIRQLGHAFLVYPGATHTRFEHAVGTYHLACRALAILETRDELAGIDAEQRLLIKLAALLHDVGHYPFSHALEEAGLPSHEDLASRYLHHPEIHLALERTGVPGAATRIQRLISGSGDHPLGGLIASSLDLDKIEYLTRDAWMTGVPYGAVDVDRLIHALAVVTLPTGQRTVGVREKGITALESLLFARYQMYRNVYWHHAVRSATAMFKRVVQDAIDAGHLDAAWIAGSTDEALMVKLGTLPDTTIAERLRRRHLYKRLVEIPGDEMPAGVGGWIDELPDLNRDVENALAVEMGLASGELLLDFPAKAQMMAADLPILTEGGEVLWREGETPPEARLGIHGVAHTLYAGARQFRLLTAEPRTVDRVAVITLLEQSATDLREALSTGRSLL